MMDASKFFFGLEKKNGQSRFIHALRSETGQEHRDSNEIWRRAVCFYSELYSSDYKEDKEMFESFCGGLPKVAVETNAELEKPLVLQEQFTALKSMEGGKAPGIDGIPVEFFKEFWMGMGEDNSF
ncbi:hypothetical protein NHX12_008756 [Muraenolepis orangiensis]|uniref:Uncharacterized protein n=1 Tax=Muraenolepis orangiensis TaxID=630683 RepID=A0A9Q0DNP8_9TELE|nr:hypothetical protein NHX12_008756 [Muraenolepis orangiensis]